VTLHLSQFVYLCIFSPLVGGILVGLFGKTLGRIPSHRFTIALMIVSFLSAATLFNALIFNHHAPIHLNLFSWVVSGSAHLEIGLLVDNLTVMMMVVVTFVSSLVHIYSIGYMHDDDGYQRFFSYMSVFTFAMLSLVGADNFVLLFFGWEGVGLVSYLLIGFYFEKESAVVGSLKAFMVNRVGDLGFLLAIALILYYFGTLSYLPVFDKVPAVLPATMNIFPGLNASVITVICVLLFVGAAGKSAQMPLHVWLPESMEGPTPISALIHAATMVTAGVYMVCRMSPLFQFSVPAQTLVIVLGGLTALFTGILGVFQFDIKRVIAYSTLSQLGYMMVAAGASAYNAAMFHLMMHACFKALLFLAAGSVIVGMHHEQDMRKMGGLWRHMPVTWICFAIGGLALSAIPPFSGFFSKDTIIDAAKLSTIPGASFAYWCVLLGAFITGLYTFRGFFMTFHGKERFAQHGAHKVKESPWVITMPLVLLAIPSLLLGGLVIHSLLYAHPTAFGNAFFVLPEFDVLATLGKEFHGAGSMMLDAFTSAPFWLAIIGIAVAWMVTIGAPEKAASLKPRFAWFMKIMDCKYGFDALNDLLFVRGAQKLGKFFYYTGDVKIVDGGMVHGTGRIIMWFAELIKRLQTGYLYHYAFSMIMGVFVFFLWVLLGGK
jgi:NADH-quinone oxidoreductase subunit L